MLLAMLELLLLLVLLFDLLHGCISAAVLLFTVNALPAGEPNNSIMSKSCKTERSDWRDEIGFFAVRLVRAMQFYKFQSCKPGEI